MIDPAFASPAQYKRQVFYKQQATRMLAERNGLRFIVGRVFLQCEQHSLQRTEFVACATFNGVQSGVTELLGEDFTKAIFREAIAQGHASLSDSFLTVQVLGEAADAPLP